jgi:hypothetical protein
MSILLKADPILLLAVTVLSLWFWWREPRSENTSPSWQLEATVPQVWDVFLVELPWAGSTLPMGPQGNFWRVFRDPSLSAPSLEQQPRR